MHSSCQRVTNLVRHWFIGLFLKDRELPLFRAGLEMDQESVLATFDGHYLTKAKSSAAHTAATWAALHCSGVARGLSGYTSVVVV